MGVGAVGPSAAAAAPGGRWSALHRSPGLSDGNAPPAPLSSRGRRRRAPRRWRGPGVSGPCPCWVVGTLRAPVGSSWPTGTEEGPAGLYGSRRATAVGSREELAEQWS